MLLLSLHAFHPVNGSSGSSRSSSSSSRAAGSGGGGSNHYGSTTRHSYSLSTFSPNGDIDQIVRAMRASMLGLPLLALSVPRLLIEEDEKCEEVNDIDHHASSALTDAIISESSSLIHSTTSRTLQGCKGGSIYLCLPQRYISTSPLCIDTGTPHILQLTSSICLSHTGISADGRSLLDYAIELTLDYRYVYGVEMPVQELLMGLADKMMEMTRRAGWRPFGCALLVMSLGDSVDEWPTMYRVDPSGVVVLLNPPPSQNRISNDDDNEDDNARGCVAISFLGNWDAILPRREMDDIRERLERQASYMNVEDICKSLVDVVERTFADSTTSTTATTGAVDRSRSETKGGGNKSARHGPMLFASFTRERGLQISRIEG